VTKRAVTKRVNQSPCRSARKCSIAHRISSEGRSPSPISLTCVERDDWNDANAVDAQTLRYRTVGSTNCRLPRSGRSLGLSLFVTTGSTDG
jgi:hypothetical protein